MSRRGRRAGPGVVGRLALVLGLGGLVGFGTAACGEGGPPPPEIPGFEQPRGPTQLIVSLSLTFTRDEAPVEVPRTVVISLPEPSATPDEALLLEAAMGALLAGPTEEERAAGISSFFSDETAGLLREVHLVGDSAMVDFEDFRTRLPGAGSSAGSFALLHELNGTLFALPGIARVEYRMEGSCDIFWNFLQRSCQVVARPAAT